MIISIGGTIFNVGEISCISKISNQEFQIFFKGFGKPTLITIKDVELAYEDEDSEMKLRGADLLHMVRERLLRILERYQARETAVIEREVYMEMYLSKKS